MTQNNVDILGAALIIAILAYPVLRTVNFATSLL
jgi:hypothetical protein